MLELNFALLKPVQTRKIPNSAVEIVDSCHTIYKLNQILDGITGLLAVDIETTGVQAADPNVRVIGLGIASSSRIVYFHRDGLSPECWDYLLNWLGSPGLELFGHNIFFDAAFLLRDSGQWYNWKYCTYGMYRQLANEGFQQQSWGLKDAQKELLGWGETNEKQLDNWLVYHGYTKGPIKEGATHEERWEKFKEGKIRPDKAEMWRAPADVIGYYCGLDAASTYMILTEVFFPAIEKLAPKAVDRFNWYHQDIFITNVKLNIEQQLRGIELDTDKLIKHHKVLEQEIVEAERQFLEHPEVAPHVHEYNQSKVRAALAKMPDRFKKRKIGKEPDRLKKNGEISKNWLKWKERAEAPPETSKSWLNWLEKIEQLESEMHFNMNSGLQRQWLFYERLGYPVKLYTESGQPATDKKALVEWGEPGQLLKKNNDLVKEQGYVEGCIAAMINGQVHPQFRIPGTLTCRLAGSGGLNLQQLPKSRRYLECWRPREGYVWIDTDVDSLEQVVLTELSGDESLYKLYGPGAKENDVYLFNGAQLPIIGDKIRAAGYDPDNPTPEGIQSARKKAKTARAVAKVVTLASSYGAGANKIRQTLELSGINISYDEALQIHSAYWKLYQGVKDYEKYLMKQWHMRGGWVYNGIGRPVGCDETLTKDIINRVVQSTGHDILMMINYELEQLRLEMGRPVFYPIIIDFHDESLVECKEEDAEIVCELFRKAYARVNEYLGGEIMITGTPELIDTLADAKCE